MLTYWEWILIVIGAVVALVLIYFLIVYLTREGVFKKDDVRIDGKVVVITGANAGIGKETALDLAKRGAKVYLACRDLKKAEVARLEIVQKSGNQNVFTKKLDLASFDSIREFVDDFKRTEDKLHILINNAGIMAVAERQETKDGLEMQIGTNHFGHFLLTNLLLDVIKLSAPARIINVSSEGHKIGRINKVKDDLLFEKSYNKWIAYGTSKLANILFTRALARRLCGTGVTVNSLHPGVVKTELGKELSRFIQILLKPMYVFLKTPKMGAQTSIMLAVDPDLNEVTGKYFADCDISNESADAKSDEIAEWLWNESVQLTKLQAWENSTYRSPI